MRRRHARHPRPRSTSVGQALAGELRACGVDFSFAPVLDLDYGGSSVIGEPQLSSRSARGGAAGQERDARHAADGHGQLRQVFSGHGFVQGTDSHVEIPVDRRSLERHPGDDARPLRLAVGHARRGDAGARDLTEGR